MTASPIRLPNASNRCVIIGETGTGKTTAGAWILSKQDFERRPWIALDYKNEDLWDLVGDPPMRPLRLGEMPGKKGLYRLSLRPGDEDATEEWLWKIWERENVGLFCDEVSLIPQKNAFKAILRQGRSKRIPVISCTQRPVDCDREVFTESQFIQVFRVTDERDYKTIKGFTGRAPIDVPLPERHSYWYDKAQNRVSILKPVPHPDTIARTLRQKAPYSWWLGG